MGHGVIACLLILGSPSSSAIGRRKELEWPMLLAVSDAKSFAGMWGFPPALWLEAVGLNSDSCRSVFLLCGGVGKGYCTPAGVLQSFLAMASSITPYARDGTAFPSSALCLARDSRLLCRLKSKLVCCGIPP